MSLALILILPFIGALFPSLIIRQGRNACTVATAFFSLLAFVLLLTHVPAVLRGEFVAVGWNWIPSLGLNFNFYLDGLGLLFSGLILGIGLLVIVYARFYLSKNDSMGKLFTYLLLFQGAMLGIVLSDNILILLIFWELTSLSSFLLIGFWGHLPEGRQGARMALAVTGAGGLSMIAGMLVLGNIVGSYNLSQILQHKELIQSSSLYLPALILILGGCFTKSAQFPFHFWLPHAMAAPTPVSAYLHSATMVKAGVFLMAKMWPVLAGTEAWFYIVATTGLITMLMGAVIALFKDDLKALLAYSTVSHLGLMTMLFGFGTPMAAVAGIFHILNHATFKAALFMNAGIIDHETGTRDIKRLGGLLLILPITATMAIISAGSMAGFPLLNGFLSKEMMLEEASKAFWFGQPWVFPVLATLAAVFSVAYSLRYIFHVFFGPRKAVENTHPHDPPFGMWLPPAVLVLLVPLIGLFPETFAGALVRATAKAVIGGPIPDFHLSLWHGFTPALAMSAIALGLGVFICWRYLRLNNMVEKIPVVQAKALFDKTVNAMISVSQKLIHGFHNGSLQRYFFVLIASTTLLGFVTYFSNLQTPGLRPTLAAPPVAIAAFLVLLVCCAIIVTLHRQRLVALVTVGVVGLMVSVGFVYLSAPDLALTQISVEVVTVILILLALSLLPKTTPKESGKARRLRDAVLSIFVGAGLGGLTWAVITRDFSSISEYYLAQSKPLGGGTNVVNVILVDFRGFDTFGEITVLGIAALAIFALLDGALRGATGAKLAAWVSDQARSADRHPLLMVVATRVMLPLMIMVGVYIFLRGHNLPGGGFIAGLVISIALIVQYMASGFNWAAKRMRFDYHKIIGAGIMIAALTGIGAMLMGFSFLKSAFGYVPIPLIGKTELASALFFDVGVFLTVVGAVMLALASLSQIQRRATHLPDNREASDLEKGR